jgi:hypothetical protein
MPRTALLALAIALAAPRLHAQVTVLDEGTFTHSVGGTRLGREDFSIRSSRSAVAGLTYVAQANVLAGERRRTVLLTADSAGGPVRFQLEARDATVLTTSVIGERQRGLWLGRIVTERRESAREFRLPEGTLVAEPGVVHHLWFFIRFGQERPVVLLSPSGPSQDSVTVGTPVADSVTIGPQVLGAQRWELRGLRDGALRWEVWTDRAGRVLRARHAASGLEALRDDAPSETLVR